MLCQESHIDALMFTNDKQFLKECLVVCKWNQVLDLFPN